MGKVAPLVGRLRLGPPPIVLNGPQSSGTPPSITSNGYAIMNALADRAIAQYAGASLSNSDTWATHTRWTALHRFTGGNDLPTGVAMN